MAQIPVLVLKSGRDKSVRNRHPWLFSGSVKQRPQGKTGDIVAVHSNKSELLAYGHYAPDATLICRMFAFGSEAIDIDEQYWASKLESALAYRKSCLNLKETSGFRLVHAEGDGLPGIVVDLYGDAASVQLRTKGALAIRPVIQEFLEKQLGINHIYLSTEKKKNNEENGSWVKGEQSETTFKENGFSFKINIATGQKTGFFLDQRDNRACLMAHAKGRKVLNAFSYSGAFSIYALAGQAKFVHSVDISARAILEAEQNVDLNFSEQVEHKGIKADCFQYLKDMEKDQYDLIVLDPPAFTKHISTVKRASRGYKEINLKAMQKIAPNGLIFTFSCSQHISKDLFRKIVFGAAADAGREVKIVKQLDQAPDHPINIYHPEGEYLKGLLLHVK